MYDTEDVPALDYGDGVEGGLGFAVLDSFETGIQIGAQVCSCSSDCLPCSLRMELSGVLCDCKKPFVSAAVASSAYSCCLPPIICSCGQCLLNLVLFLECGLSLPGNWLREIGIAYY